MVQTTIVSVGSVQHLAENILRIEIDRPVGFNFKPGQFARVGINPNNDGPDKIWRAQTIVSRAGESKSLAFYISRNENDYDKHLSQYNLLTFLFLDLLNEVYQKTDRTGEYLIVQISAIDLKVQSF